MDLRRLGQTNLEVSALSLGTVELGLKYGIAPRQRLSQSGLPPPSLAEAARLLHHALDNGINFVDTARGYGSSESVIGQVLSDRRDEMVLATKVSCFGADGQILRGTALRRQIEASITASLHHLRTDWVDLLMIHSAPAALLQAGEAVAMLADVRERGLARHIGASTYGTDAPRLAIEQGVEVLQVAYNVLDQRMADEIFPLAQKRGVGIVVRSVYLKGALTARAEDLPPHLDALKQRSRMFRQTAASLAPPLGPVEAALRFALSRADVDTVLVGVRSLAELDEAVQAAEAGPLAADIIKQLEQQRWDESPLLDPSNWAIP